jgi:hypothetical protein
VEAELPTTAWKELLKREGAEKRATGVSGVRLFGLDNLAVARLVQALPNADRCHHFEAWLSAKPDLVPLVSGPRPVRFDA